MNDSRCSKIVVKPRADSAKIVDMQEAGRGKDGCCDQRSQDFH